jgi:hypothetical protein
MGADVTRRSEVKIFRLNGVRTYWRLKIHNKNATVFQVTLVVGGAVAHTKRSTPTTA